MVDLRGTGGTPPGPNSFNFMQFWGKFGKIICWRPPPLSGELVPPPRGNPGATSAKISRRKGAYCNRKRKPEIFQFYENLNAMKENLVSWRWRVLWEWGWGLLGQTPPSLGIRHWGFFTKGMNSLFAPYS